MALSLLPTAALAVDETTGAGPIKVGNASYESFSEAVSAAEPDENGVITYEISGKVDVTDTGWVQVAKAGLTDLSKVEFIGRTDDAEICITQGEAILADQSNDIDVSFENLKLTKLNPQWAGDLGHSTNYFTCWLRNTDAAKNTVTYTKCTFPNGVCNNQYGNTVFDDCKFTNATSGKFNLWNYGGNTEVKNSEFTGTRGIKMYNEGTLQNPPSIEIKNTNFTGMTEKAAIVVSKAANVTLNTVDATDCINGLLQKDIEGSTDEQKVTIEANGTDISGEFNITGQKDAEAAKNEFNISGGTFTSKVEQDYCKDGFEVKVDADGNYTVEMNPVAKVGTTEYNTLEAAFAALNSNNYKLELLGEESVQKAVWPENTPVYWEAGDKSGGYVAKLTDALTAAYKADAGDITIVCRPGANVGTMTHGHVADNLTIYGNNAYLSGGECDLEVDTYMYSRKTGAQANDGAYLDKNITITAYEMDNLGVWGQRNTKHTVTVNLIDCDGREISDQSNNQQRVYISGTSGANNITLTDCDFITAATAVYSNADGSITIDGCSFTDGQAPVNFNHKANGTQTVTVKNSTFTNCGDDGAWKQFAAPIRFVNSGGGTMSANVDDCTITDTVGNNGDILIGDGRTNETSNNVTLTVSGTAADVQAQKPGYYNGVSTDDSKKAERELTADESLNTTIADLLPVTEVDLDEFIKLVTSAGYNFDGASVAGTGEKLTVKWSPVSGCFDTRSGHTCTVGNEAATGNTPNRVNSELAQYQLFKEATDVTIKNVNFEYIPANFTICANSGWKGSWTGDVVKSAQLQLETTGHGDVTIEGCSFDHVVFTSWQNSGETVIKNSAFKNIYGSYAIKDLGGSSVEVSDCTFENCGGGIMLDSNSGRAVTPNPVTISGNTFTKVDVDGTTPENEVSTRGLLQIPSKGDYTNTDIILDGNTATNCGPILRQLNQGIADNDVLSKKLKGDLTGLGGELTFTSNSVDKTGGEKPVQPTIYTVKFSGSDVADKKVLSGTTITLPTAAKSGYTFKGWSDGSATYKVGDEAVITKDTTFTALWSYNGSSSGGGSSEPSGDYIVSVDRVSGGKVTVNPGRADKGDEVTVTVKPNDGYELDELVVTDSKGNEVKLTAKSSTKFTFTMPAGTVDIKATFVKIDAGSVLDDFTDVNPNAWYAEAVEFVVEEGLMTGTSSTTFAPDTSMSRAMIWTVLAAYNDYNTSGGNPWYAPGQQWAMVNGVSDGTAPNGSITREQLAVMLWRAAGSPETSKSLSGYADASSVSDWALTAMAWAVDNGIISGMGGSSLAPQTTATRAQVAVMLMQFVNYMEG